MKRAGTKRAGLEGDKHVRHQVRLPGFILDQELGLGSAVKRVVSTLGIGPCGGCEQRAAGLDRWLVFTGKRRQ